MEKELYQDGDGLPQTVVLKDSEITGEMNISGDMLLMGKVSGNVNCSGHAVITEGSEVSGSLKSRSLDLDGIVGGNVKTELLSLRDHGKIYGLAEVKKLRIVGMASGLNAMCLSKKV